MIHPLTFHQEKVGPLNYHRDIGSIGDLGLWCCGGDTVFMQLPRTPVQCRLGRSALEWQDEGCCCNPSDNRRDVRCHTYEAGILLAIEIHYVAYPRGTARRGTAHSGADDLWDWDGRC